MTALEQPVEPGRGLTAMYCIPLPDLPRNFIHQGLVDNINLYIQSSVAHLKRMVLGPIIQPKTVFKMANLNIEKAADWEIYYTEYYNDKEFTHKGMQNFTETIIYELEHFKEELLLEYNVQLYKQFSFE